MDLTPPLSKYPDLGDRVYHLLREQILSGQMPPGSLLLGVELARDMGVSRTPVSDALNVLAAEGLVQVTPRRGYFVASFELADYAELMDARLAIELSSVERSLARDHGTSSAVLEQQLAAMQAYIDEAGGYRDYHEWNRLDMRFHELLVESAGNRYLTESHRRLTARVQLANVHFALAGCARPALGSAEEHSAILAAFTAGQLPALRAALERHVGCSVEHYAATLPERPVSAPVEQAPSPAPANRRLHWPRRQPAVQT